MNTSTSHHHPGRFPLLALFGPSGSSASTNTPPADISYFQPSSAAYLSRPWDSASADECTHFLTQVRSTSQSLSNKHYYALRAHDTQLLLRFESALQSVLCRFVHGSNQLEGIGPTLDETTRLCSTYFRGDTTGNDEVTNHVRAFLFLAERVRTLGILNEVDLLQAHSILLGDDYTECQQHGQYRTTHCTVGSTPLISPSGEVLTPSSPSAIPSEMKLWLQKYNESLCATLETAEPIYSAIVLSKNFLHMHPFQDGNGRLVRILENILVNTHYQFVLLLEDTEETGFRRNYHQTIRSAIKKGRAGFIAYKGLKNALRGIRALEEGALGDRRV